MRGDIIKRRLISFAFWKDFKHHPQLQVPSSNTNNTNISSDPPKITSACHTIHGSEGSSASISCPVIGNPYPNITWYQGNETSPSTMINTNIILQFPETELDDRGWYTCFAENYLGSVTVTVQLLVGKLYVLLLLLFCF